MYKDNFYKLFDSFIVIDLSVDTCTCILMDLLIA